MDFCFGFGFGLFTHLVWSGVCSVLFGHVGWYGSLFYSLARAVLRFRWMDAAGSRTYLLLDRLAAVRQGNLHINM
jgi:hypothetical protein